MKSKYDIDEKTPTNIVWRMLSQARAEDKIYVVAGIVEVLKVRGYDLRLLHKEERKLFKAIRDLRAGKKQLARWLPIGYQLARFIFHAKHLCGPLSVRVTEQDRRRIKRAADYYWRQNDYWSRRQLRSLVFTAKYIGVEL